MSETIKLKVGPSGNSDSFYAQGFSQTQETFLWQRQHFALDAFELPFGRGVSLSDETALKIAQAARENEVSLSAHAPYYINLANPDYELAEKSIGYILTTARILNLMGGSRVVVHVGSPKYADRKEALALCADRLLETRERLVRDGFDGIRLCLETMGRPSVLGTMDEIITLVNLDDSFLPYLDFAHLHAISEGALVSAGAFETVLDTVEAGLGIVRARQSHIHFSRIEFGKKGEIRHRTFTETEFGPDFGNLAPLLVDREYEGTIICESRGTMAEDAFLIREQLKACLSNK